MYSSVMNDHPEASVQQEEDSLVQALLRLGHLVDVQLNAALESLGLSLPKLIVLQNLLQAGGSLPLGLLSERQGCVKSNVTQLVDRLEADNLVRRVPDPQDRRSILATITEEGRHIYHAGKQKKELAERELLSGLSTTDQDHLAVLLGRFGEGHDRR